MNCPYGVRRKRKSKVRTQNSRKGFIPAEGKGHGLWPGCRPTGALLRNYGHCPWGSTGLNG